MEWMIFGVVLQLSLTNYVLACIVEELKKMNGKDKKSS